MSGGTFSDVVTYMCSLSTQRNGNYISRKHAYIILTPLDLLLYSKTGVFRGIHYFSYFVKIIDLGYSLEPRF